MREHLLSVSYKPNYTTMNNFQDESCNGYTNIQTYRLCLVLDNQQFVDNPLKTFLELLEENVFEGNDIDVINWNEVMQRYSDNILIENTFRRSLEGWR